MPRRPSPGNISSPYGERWHPIRKRWQMHTGEDIGWGNGAGTTLVAPQRAQLIDYRDRGDWGMQARLRAGNVEHRLSHTERLWPALEIGEWLDEGQDVAVMGETGLADGVHVHWEVLIDGQYVDPAGWLAAAASAGTKTNNKEEEMIIRIKGKAGVRHGGLYMFTGGQAIFLGDDGGSTAGVVTISDEGVISKLAARFSGDL